MIKLRDLLLLELENSPHSKYYYYFHATNTKKIDSILRNGLDPEIPQSGVIWANRVKTGSKLPDDGWIDFYDQDDDVIIVFKTKKRGWYSEQGYEFIDLIEPKEFTNIIHKGKIYTPEEFKKIN